MNSKLTSASGINRQSKPTRQKIKAHTVQWGWQGDNPSRSLLGVTKHVAQLLKAFHAESDIISNYGVVRRARRPFQARLACGTVI